MYHIADSKHGMQNWSDVSRRLQLMTSQPYNPKRYLREGLEYLVKALQPGTHDSIHAICPYIWRFEEDSLIGEIQISYPLAVNEPLDQLNIENAVKLISDNFVTIDGGHVEEWIGGHPAAYEEVVFLLREGQFCCLNSDGNPDEMMARQLPQESQDYYAGLLFEAGSPWANGQYAHIRHPHSQSLRGKHALAAAGVYVVCQDWAAIRYEVLPRVRFLLVEFVSMLLLQAADEHYRERLEAEDRMKRLEEDSKKQQHISKAAAALVESLSSAAANIQFLNNTLHAAPAAILEIYRRPGTFIPPDEGDGTAFYVSNKFRHSWPQPTVCDQCDDFHLQVACILLSYIGVEFPSRVDLPWPEGTDSATQMLRASLERAMAAVQALYSLDTRMQQLVEEWVVPQKALSESEAKIAEDVFELLKCIFCRPFHEEKKLRTGLLAAWASRCRVNRTDLVTLLKDPNVSLGLPTEALRGLNSLQFEAGCTPNVRLAFDGAPHVTLRFPGCSDDLITNADGFWIRYSKGGEPPKVPGSLDWAMWYLNQFRRNGLEVTFSRDLHFIEVTF